MGIGNRIKELRKQLSMTQSVLAEMLGVHETTIRRWELEKDKGPDTAMIKKLSEVLKVSPEYLLGDGDDENIAETSPDKTLIYEWGGTNRLALPNTPETRKLFERLVMCSITGKTEGKPAMA